MLKANYVQDNGDVPQQKAEDLAAKMRADGAAEGVSALPWETWFFDLVGLRRFAPGPTLRTSRLIEGAVVDVAGLEAGGVVVGEGEEGFVVAGAWGDQRGSIGAQARG